MDILNRVVVTGIGVIAGNACGKEAFSSACINGILGITKCDVFDTSDLMTDYFGEVLTLSEEEKKNRWLAMTKLAVSEMFQDSKTDAGYIKALGTKCKLFFGTLLSTTETIFGYAEKLIKQEQTHDELACMNEYITNLKELTGVRGGAYISSAACAAGTTACGMAFDYIRNGLCHTAVVGGTDILTNVAAFGFHSLKSLSVEVCNPYDEIRDGINIGECSAFFLFEDMEHAIKRNAHIYAEVVGYGLNNDAYHMTSPDPEGTGAYYSMKMAIDEAGISPQDVDYINGHGTGTPINDQMEAKAISRLFEGTCKKPAVSSTKALIGHCMGASGSGEFAATILSMEKSQYIPLPSLKTPLIETKNMIVDSKTFPLEIVYSLSNSFAFAGNTSSVAVKKLSGNRVKQEDLS